ncbi:MAG: GNAT family N-acetyltransferase [Proteobacteria bacterium]|nr:GNAT family N-acetyltransferase [Pseudomonadota bacterium]
MDLTLRPAAPEDAEICGKICYEAFAAIATRHNFPPDFPSPEIAASLLSGLIAHPGFYGAVAERDGRVLGSNFIDERSPIAGIGPITVDPATQDNRVGRRLMEHMLERVVPPRFPGVRLVQAAYHNRSLCLYSKLGFEARELLSTMQGPPISTEIAGYRVRTATEDDLITCNRLCHRIHGHERGGELLDAIKQGTARLVEHAGRVTGYATSIAFFGHAVGESNEELKALIGAADAYPGPGFLLPSRNGELLRWCLGHGLRVVQPMTLMSMGLYNEPAGAFLPSILL